MAGNIALSEIDDRDEHELDNRTPEVSNTLVQLPEPGAMGTTPNEKVTKLDGIEEANKEGLMEHEL